MQIRNGVAGGAVKTLADRLSEQTREAAELSQQLDGYRLRCVACSHRCPIPAGFSGVCKVRFNRGGKLYAPYGYVSTVQCDPIEKKPFFHALPGTRALSFGMLGCDLHCGYCQNWVTSQSLRDMRSSVSFTRVDPEELVRAAIESGSGSIVSTYNEPLITSEWAVSVFRRARKAGLTTGFVSNGNATPEVLEYLRPWLDVYKVDLKSFDDRHYHELGGRIAPVLDSIQRIHDMSFWLEIVTLIIPGFNDSDQELTSIAKFLAAISPDIPWHVTAFHQDYTMTGPENTPAKTLIRAAAIGRDAGLRFVYAGNLPGQVDHLEDTLCPGCRALLIRRHGFRVREYRISDDGRCPDCSASIPGRWAGPTPARHSPIPLVHIRCG